MAHANILCINRIPDVFDPQRREGEWNGLTYGKVTVIQSNWGKIHEVEKTLQTETNDIAEKEKVIPRKKKIHRGRKKHDSQYKKN